MNPSKTQRVVFVRRGQVGRGGSSWGTRCVGEEGCVRGRILALLVASSHSLAFSLRPLFRCLENSPLSRKLGYVMPASSPTA